MDLLASMGQMVVHTTYHSTLKMTPFEAIYGRAPPVIPNYTTGSSFVDEMDHTLQDQTKVLRFLKDNLNAAQARIKQDGKYRSKREFKVGDWVFLRLQPYRQISVNVHPSKKLLSRFYGSYKVLLEHIGLVAYCLDLPSKSKIHYVFHVYCLKKKLGE